MVKDILDDIFGEEVQHLISYDSAGRPLEGDKNYKLHLPCDIPARNYWSVILYDSQTRLIIKNVEKWPSINSNCKKTLKNQDGSVDLLFGPHAPEGKEPNWLQSDPKIKWYMILHLYGPSESWFDKSWRPGEIEELK
jgi:hypothetical protein